MVSTSADIQEITATNVLIVEDEGIIAGHIASRLLRTGYTVAGIAESAEEALQKAVELKPELILMDIRIKGGMDGIETATRIRDLLDIPVIYLTAHTDQQTIDRAKITGAYGFLTKPIHHTSLATAIEMAVHKHRAERAVREQRAWMSTVLSAMADAVMLVNRQGKVQFMNSSAERLTGHNNSSVAGLPVSEVLQVEGPASLVLTEFFGTADSSKTAVRFPRGSTATGINGRAFPLEGEICASLDSGAMVGGVITFRDVTARQAEDAVVHHEQKMQAVGRLAAGVAHDFNNLLFLILGYTDELAIACSGDVRQANSLNEIRKAGEAAAAITQQLLKFSRKEVMAKRDIDLNHTIRDCEELIRRMAGRGIEWNLTLQNPLPPLYGDAAQLKQVLMNLVSNARDAMPQGGSITIETALVSIQPEDGIGAAERCVALIVRDTGSGMDQETAQRLFEPFFTTKQPGNGTGLGLSIVHTIVTDFGATIHVDSSPGEGTAFTMYFPVKDASFTAGTGVANPTIMGQNQTATILLVEDQPSVRSLLRSHLERAGHLVLEAKDGEDAIRVAALHDGPIDLLVTDISMAQANGFDVARSLNESRSLDRVIFISGYAEELVEGLEHLPPRSRFLPKPFAKRDLLKNVTELLADRGNKTSASGQ